MFCNGDQVAGPTSRSIVEINNTGTQVFSTTVLPTEIKDPEALCYDASHDVFFVGGGFSPDIWVVDRGGNILQKLDVLEGYRNPVGPTSAHVKDLELAPSSDPNDDPGTLNLYVADYGNSHVSDGRVLEIADPFSWSSPASVVSTSNLTTVQSPAQPGAAPNITPQSTSGTNVILATNSQDVLTGSAAQDQFVFAPTPSGPSVQHTITDFEVGIDKIDVSQFSNISASALPTETQQGSDTLVTLDGHDALLLKNVAAVNLHGSDFIVHA